jgi:hypothetical protein
MGWYKFVREPHLTRLLESLGKPLRHLRCWASFSKEAPSSPGVPRGMVVSGIHLGYNNREEMIAYIVPLLKNRWRLRTPLRDYQTTISQATSICKCFARYARRRNDRTRAFNEALTWQWFRTIITPAWSVLRVVPTSPRNASYSMFPQPWNRFWNALECGFVNLFKSLPIYY